MRELGPDRLSEDGSFLIARDAVSGDEFSVRIDDTVQRLIALSEQRRRPVLTRKGKTMDISLSPREIQARIRRGETVSEVADAAGASPEQISGFAAPVLAERTYMAEQARETPLRRKHVSGTPVALGELIDENLAQAGVIVNDAAWDAWRREDGRWAVIVTPEGHKSAHFIFDVKSRYVLPADEVAHDLVGDIAHPDEPQFDMALADAVASSEEGDLPPVDLPQSHEETAHARVASLKEARDRRAQGQLGQGLASTAGQYTIDGQLDFEDLDLDHLGHGTARGITPETTRVARKQERRRVPSWDEIMFGGRDA
ncbi:MAG: septation protein SepH [Aeromicrobium sp.]|uniref:septation protein SepH n=1 Tax=Aeromicrobium sp. TaxID=1871063 RepID=UPI0039E29D9E